MLWLAMALVILIKSASFNSLLSFCVVQCGSRDAASKTLWKWCVEHQMATRRSWCTHHMSSVPQNIYIKFLMTSLSARVESSFVVGVSERMRQSSCTSFWHICSGQTPHCCTSALHDRSGTLCNRTGKGSYSWFCYTDLNLPATLSWTKVDLQKVQMTLDISQVESCVRAAAHELWHVRFRLKR